MSTDPSTGKSASNEQVVLESCRIKPFSNEAKPFILLPTPEKLILASREGTVLEPTVKACNEDKRQNSTIKAKDLATIIIHPPSVHI